MAKQILLIMLCFLLFGHLQAQDSTSQNIRISFVPNVWMQQNFESDQTVNLPSLIRNQRWGQQVWQTSSDAISDNPLRHGALYFECNTQLQYKNKLKLNLDLFAEQRGASYGLFDKSNLLIFPVFSIEGKDTIEIVKHSIKLSGKAGYFLNEQLNEGATIFNVDAEGWKIGVELNKWFLEGTLYADFSNGIGLQLDDVYALSLRKVFGKKDSSCIGISYAEFKKLPWLNNNYLGSLFGHLQFANLKLYAELSCRLDNTRNNNYYTIENKLTQKMAALLGASYAWKKNGFSFMGVFEARYFGAIYNEEYFDFRLRYRDPNGGSYANSVGKYIYPLRKFDRPFSQWSVYTEYIGSQVFSLNCRGAMKQHLAEKLNLQIEYDINYINARNYDNSVDPFSSFVYPFFTASVNYQLMKEAEVGFILTNKAMNLDISYPTHYLLQNPVFGLKLMTHF